MIKLIKKKEKGVKFMESKDSLTAVDVAELLKITKNTVYEIVKRGELPAYKVGKKLRIDKQDVEDYINNQKGRTSRSKSSKIEQNEPIKVKETIIMRNNIVVSGQDAIIDILVDKINEKVTGVRAYKSNIGSYKSLCQLYNDEISISTTHLWDGDTNEYNTSFVRKLVPGIPCLIVNLAHRMQGFYVQKGNPLNIKGFEDLTKSEVKFINREKGSGTRVLLDEQLRLKNIDSKLINGYNEERNSHILVASSVASGNGNVGIGTEKFAVQVKNIDFIPFQEEQYDLVIKVESLNNPVYKLIVDVVQSDEFKKEIQGLGGYNLKDTGKIIART